MHGQLMHRKRRGKKRIQSEDSMHVQRKLVDGKQIFELTGIMHIWSDFKLSSRACLESGNFAKRRYNYRRNPSKFPVPKLGLSTKLRRHFLCTHGRVQRFGINTLEITYRFDNRLQETKALAVKVRLDIQGGKITTVWIGELDQNPYD